MAYTVTKTPTVFGNEKVVHLLIDADAATQTVETGLTNIVAYAFGHVSMTTYSVAGIKIAVNSNASGVATPGSLGISGATAGDKFYVTVFGR
jgi:hypothetical protein